MSDNSTGKCCITGRESLAEGLEGALVKSGLGSESSLEYEDAQQFLFPKLDPHETKSLNGLKPTYRQRFLSSCQGEYDATMEAYEVIYPHPSDGPRYALDTCRDFACFALDRTSGAVKVMSNGCRDRWCPMCAGQKS